MNHKNIKKMCFIFFKKAQNDPFSFLLEDDEDDDEFILDFIGPLDSTESDVSSTEPYSTEPDGTESDAVSVKDDALDQALSKIIFMNKDSSIEDIDRLYVQYYASLDDDQKERLANKLKERIGVDVAVLDKDFINSNASLIRETFVQLDTSGVQFGIISLPEDSVDFND